MCTGVHGHLIATVVGLVELVRVLLLHLDTLALLVSEARIVTCSLQRKVMIVLSVLGRAAIIALGIRLARMSALLLDEDSFEGCSSAAISDHHLLGVVEHLRVVDSARSGILLLGQVMLFSLLISHV